MFNNRTAGILLHPTSLPGKYGIGDLGKHAYEFVDFLKKANQTFWQMLPVTVVDDNGSPYSSYSAFARNPLLIDLDELVSMKLLEKSDLKGIQFNDSKLELEKVHHFKEKALQKAARKFWNEQPEELMKKYKSFARKNKYWLEEYSFFISLTEYYKEKRQWERENEETSNFEEFYKRVSKHLTKKEAEGYYYGAVWISWKPKVVRREKKALDKHKKLLNERILFHKFNQFMFDMQWTNLKKYANENGIKLIGDIPIFVAYNSSDVWTTPEMFYLDKDGFPTSVSGVPPDYFSKEGQLWGNPLYKWSVHKLTKYKWWTSRIKHVMSHFDVIRLDHFRAFESYWKVKYGSENAMNGKWVKGPGKHFFNQIEKELGHLPIIAEDLGIITEEVEELRDECNLPGLAIIQFGFDGIQGNMHLPNNTKQHTIAYTGTHDNDTTLGWYNSLDDHTRWIVEEYLKRGENTITYSCIESVYNGNANTAIIPLQDVLELDSSARMNKPGVAKGNWSWRFTEDMLTDDHANRLSWLVDKYNRSR